MAGSREAMWCISLEGERKSFFFIYLFSEDGERKREREGVTGTKNINAAGGNLG